MAPRSSGGELLVLAYHAISPTWSAALSVTPEAFERQVAHLSACGWTSATFADAARNGVSGKTFVVTFDDAFASVYRYAAPVLRRHGAVATVFAPTDYITRAVPLTWAGLDGWARGRDAGELTAMTWEQLGELAEQGWEIGSHTCSHPRLTRIGDGALEEELRRSREEIAGRIGRPVETIAYPYGDVDSRVEAHVRAAGYAAAAGTRWPHGTLDPHEFPRIGVYHKDSWTRFRLKLALGAHPRLAAWLLPVRGVHMIPYL